MHREADGGDEHALRERREVEDAERDEGGFDQHHQQQVPAVDARVLVVEAAVRVRVAEVGHRRRAHHVRERVEYPDHILHAVGGGLEEQPLHS